MPPKQQFSQEKILSAAFELLRQGGWSSVTARNISQKLKSSTQPLYSYLKSMDDLALNLRALCLEELINYQIRPYTENIFMNMAVGYVKFAQEEKNIFKFLFFDKPVEQNHKANSAESKWVNQEIKKRTGEDISVASYLGSIDQNQMDQLTLNSWLFTHGLAVTLSTGALKSMTDKKIIEMLSNAGYAFYLLGQK
jgi:AcrR family transcriptional regulator